MAGVAVTGAWDPQAATPRWGSRWSLWRRVQALFDLEATNAELKADLRDLYITSAKEIDVHGTSRKAVIVHVSAWVGEMGACIAGGCPVFGLLHADGMGVH
jgi:hypothetical protein